MSLRPLVMLTVIASLAGCGSNLFAPAASNRTTAQQEAERAAGIEPGESRGTTLRDLLRGGDNANVTLGVNKYIWNASLDVLNFLPIESVDPFTGVIVMGYGTPPGGGRAYRATVYVQDPALDARSLKLSMQTRGGAAVAPATLSAIEDAILTRARQMRVADSGL